MKKYFMIIKWDKKGEIIQTREGGAREVEKFKKVVQFIDSLQMPPISLKSWGISWIKSSSEAV